MNWPTRWTKPVYVKRMRGVKVTLAPLTRGVRLSYKIGPVSITSTGRVYLFGARVL